MDAVAKQYARYQKADDAAHASWAAVDRELKKLVKLAKLGRKATKVVPISDTRGIEIRNQFKNGELKVFAPAFAKKFKVKEVALASE